jgi:hypothetical protein
LDVNVDRLRRPEGEGRHGETRLSRHSLHECLFLSIALAALGAASAHAQDNPAARRGAADFTMLGGFWNGANLEMRSNCTSAQNNGRRGTYAEYNISVVRSESQLGIVENTVTGLNCIYTGNYVEDRFAPKWTGSYSCSDGKRGAFESTSFLITPTEMQIRLKIKLDLSETCDVDSILGGSRF